ncbi:hypothetical protein [Thermonema rossianum]|uniref:hypothetical protein n=1 Tax=Thermonema rossianum TaxID=55505 RepID=UPI00056EBDD1|nr:hypothetical protein [Thermonema rossianum]
MKKHFYALLSCVLLYMSHAAVAQKKADSLIAGQWQLVALEIPTYEELIRNAPPEQKQQYRNEIATLIRYSSFEFRPDGTYAIYFAGSREEGTWRLDPSLSKLWIRRKEADGSFAEETFIAIERLEKNEMVLLNDYESGEIIRMKLKHLKK